MIFLVDYDRNGGILISVRHFDDSQRYAAEDARLETELALGEDERRTREIVLLEAIDEASARRTHRRYFGFDDLFQNLKAADT